MPKPTFFNLAESKRKTLIEAAEKEFSKSPLYEASIANIVKMACIPRGSFYQYFEDKEDLYFYLLDEKLKENKVHLITLLREHNGDIIETIMELYHRFLVMIPDEEERDFLKNAMLYATHKVENSFANMFHASHDNDYFKEILEVVDLKRLNIKEEKELTHILQIISAVAFHNFIEKLSKELSDEEAMKQFTMRMDLIKHGIYKSK
ncbi:TetR/AcrR family transcriptional regulator [Niallia oryzisoli]|uniref:TetR/AcrR family transcriptional regulator n=1 Tax=Niallia oryzisoli TaxID=1737571 RepID=UPI003736A148